MQQEVIIVGGGMVGLSLALDVGKSQDWRKATRSNQIPQL